MGIFEHLPYTNMHDLNLDWILLKLKATDTTLSELLENGISSEDVDIVIATYTKDSSNNWVCSKTVAELEAALADGKKLLAVISDSNETVICTRYTYSLTYHRVTFEGHRNITQAEGSDEIVISSMVAISRNPGQVETDTVSVSTLSFSAQAYSETE